MIVEVVKVCPLIRSRALALRCLRINAGGVQVLWDCVGAVKTNLKSSLPDQASPLAHLNFSLNPRCSGFHRIDSGVLPNRGGGASCEVNAAWHASYQDAFNESHTSSTL